jgi:hypothetical protein
MGKIDKVIEKILRGTSDRNISFRELCQVLHHLDFEERIKGSHHIFFKTGLDEILNLQPKDSQAKPYQVKQVRDLIVKYALLGDEDDE